MDHAHSLTSLVIVILAALLTPILLHRLKLTVIPVVVAEIIVGLIIGHSGFNLVQEGAWLEILSSLGFIFLMFLSGLEIDFTAFRKKKGKKAGEAHPLGTSVLVFLGIFLLSYGLSCLFKLTGFVDNTFLMTIIISTISLGVVVPTLKEAELMKTGIGQIILLVAVIADLVTMILLAVFVSFYEEGGNTWLLLVLFGAGILLYFIGKRFKSGSLIKILSEGTVQIGTRAVFALMIFLVALSESVGAENILGAFLAGVLVSLLMPSQELVHRLDSFGYGFFIPIFFVMVGVNLNIWELFGNPQLLLLIPLLIVAFFVSKIIPAFLLKKWFDWRVIFSSGILLTSTLSLVIAAATIGERLGILTPEMRGVLILSAIITCIFAPMLFKQWMPKVEPELVPLKVALIGMNHTTLGVYKELNKTYFTPVLFRKKQEEGESNGGETIFPFRELEQYDEVSMDKEELFQFDIAVCATSDDEINAKLSMILKRNGVERVIARVEVPAIRQRLKGHDIELYSSLESQHLLLRSAIESPAMVTLLSDRETSLYEVEIRNPEYAGIQVRHFPFTGDVIFVRIFRGRDSIVPHGDTELKLGDRLIFTGSQEYVDELKRDLGHIG